MPITHLYPTPWESFKEDRATDNEKTLKKLKSFINGSTHTSRYHLLQHLVPFLGRFLKYSKVLIEGAKEVDEEEESKIAPLKECLLLRKGLSESITKLIRYHCRSNICEIKVVILC